MTTRKMIVMAERRIVRAISFGVFWRLRPFDQADHAVQKALAGIGRDADLDLVGQDPCAAGDGAPVAARLTDDRRGFARDGRFIHRGHTFDDFAVRRNDLSGGHEEEIALPQPFGRDLFDGAVGFQAIGHGLGAGLSERLGLGLAPALGHGLREIGKEHGEPEPEGHLQDKTRRLVSRPEEKPERGEDGSHFRHEDDRVFQQARGG